jgi:hypothetical protein
VPRPADPQIHPMPPAQRHDRRLRRQLAAIAARAPWLARMLESLMRGRMRYLRIPLGVLLILGGFLAVLPVFGLWMIPLGLVILALDLPFLRGPVSAAILRLRQRLRQRRLARQRDRPGD